MTSSPRTRCPPRPRLTERDPAAGGGLDPATAFLGQLSAPTFVMDLRPRTTPVTPPLDDLRGDAATPAVVLISRAHGREFDVVANLLRRVGVPSVRIDADQLADIDLVVDPDRRLARVNGRWVLPTVAWRRHFATTAIPRDGTAAVDLFHRESWGAAVDELVDVAAVGLHSRRPGVLAQLRHAAALGIEVPAAVLTTDPYRAAELLPGDRLVIKAVHQHFVEPTPGSLTGVFPAIVARRDLVPLPRPGPPVILQEFIEHDVELRVYVVDGRTHGFRVVKDSPADPWLRGDQVLAHAVDLDEAVVRTAHQLAAALSPRYCAIDFLLRDGRPVFLEINPDGDWGWIETKADTASVTMAVTRMLRDLHHLHRPTTENGRGPFDLLSFLTGRP
jgi:hypothetical protein